MQLISFCAPRFWPVSVNYYSPFFANLFKQILNVNKNFNSVLHHHQETTIDRAVAAAVSMANNAAMSIVATTAAHQQQQHHLQVRVFFIALSFLHIK